MRNKNIEGGFMSQKENKHTFLKDFINYICVFAIVYFAIMLWKYIANGDLTWLRTFIFMFSITFIYFLLRRTKKDE